MSPVTYRLRAEARTQWRLWLGVAVLIGILGGLTMGLLAGARRTGSAYERFLATTDPSDVLIAESTDFGTTKIDLDAAAALPEVRAAAVTSVYFAVMRLKGGRLLLPGNDAIAMVDSASVGDGLDNPRAIEGRLADPDNPYEVVVGWNLANRFGIAVGDELEISLLRTESVPSVQAAFLDTLDERMGSPEPDIFDWEPMLDGPRVDVEIVGITAAPLEFPPIGGIIPIVRVTTAFEKQVGVGNWSTRYLHADLRSGASVADFQQRVEAEMSNGNPVVVYSVGAGQAESVQQGFDVNAISLATLAALIALAGLIIVAQLSARIVAANWEATQTMRAIGWGSRGLTGLALTRMLAIATAGAMLAVAFAVALSPLWPDGTAGVAEIDSGIAVDTTVLAFGFGAILMVVPLLAAWPSRPRRRSTRARRAGAPPPAMGPPVTRLGIGFALGGSSQDGVVPVRSSIVAIAMALSLVTLVLVVQGQADQLRASPAAYGWAWEMQLGSPGLANYAPIVTDKLTSVAEVGGLAAGTITNIDVAGRRVDVLAVNNVQGAIAPTLRSGTAPSGRGEIALGSLTLDAIDARVGDTVNVGVADRTEPFRIVGEVTTPTLGDQGRLGAGGFTTGDALAGLLPEMPSNVVLVDLRPDTPERVRENIRWAFAPIPTRDARNGDELGFANAIPTGALWFPLLIAVAVIANVVAMSVRRRGRELAICRALGLTRAQVRHVVFVEATIVALLALLLGAPLGIAIALTTWDSLLTRFGIDGASGIDWSRLGQLVVVVLALTWIVSIVPAWRSTRRSPAEAMRAP